MVNTLGEVVARRREELRLSREAVAEAARRAGYQLSGSYIFKVEMGNPANEGRPIKPSLEKIKALAVGLQLSTTELLKAAGVSTLGPTAIDLTQWMSEASQQIESATSDSAIFADAKYPPSQVELEILKQAAASDIFYGRVNMPGFWDRAREERWPVFVFLRTLVEETKRLNGHQAQGH